MYTFSFEKLNVWQLSRNLIKEIYLETNQFPVEEKFGLTNQIRRATVSISSNIAEGSSRTNPKDKAHYTQIAYGSLMEVLCQIIIANDLDYLSKEKLNYFRNIIDEIANKLNALRNSQLE